MYLIIVLTPSFSLSWQRIDPLWYVKVPRPNDRSSPWHPSLSSSSILDNNLGQIDGHVYVGNLSSFVFISGDGWFVRQRRVVILVALGVCSILALDSSWSTADGFRLDNSHHGIIKWYKRQSVQSFGCLWGDRIWEKPGMQTPRFRAWVLGSSGCVSSSLFVSLYLWRRFWGDLFSHIRSVTNEWSFVINISSLDADTIAHSVYSPGSQAVEDIRAEFGDDIVLEGNVIDRKKLGSIVFANRDAMSVC